MSQGTFEDKVIIPVASGKGGVGKSLLTANLAMALARAGHETIAVDLDLGGSNLHSYLGISNKFAGVGDFLMDRCAPLEEMVSPTPFFHLGFLAGDGRNPFMANITYAHKMRLFRALKTLPARYILVDLGAGSSYNTLDFFGLSSRGLVVTTPELPAIMNLMVFFKNLMLRCIAREVNSSAPLKKIVERVRNQPMNGPAWNVDDLIGQIEEISPDAAGQVRTICSSFRPRLVLNLVEHPDELRILKNVEQSLEKRISLNVDFFGCLFRDPSIRKVVGTGKPLLSDMPDTVFGEGVIQLAGRLVRLWEKPISDSRKRLIRSTEKNYRNRLESDDLGTAPS